MKKSELRKLIKEELLQEKHGMFADYFELVGYQLRDFIKSYKKLNKKNVVKVLKNDDIIGFRKGEKELHWKWTSEDSRLNHDISTNNAGSLVIKRYSKEEHPWG